MKRGLTQKQMRVKLRELQDRTPDVRWGAYKDLRDGLWRLMAQDAASGSEVVTEEGLQPVALARYIDGILTGLRLAQRASSDAAGAS